MVFLFLEVTSMLLEYFDIEIVLPVEREKLLRCQSELE